MFFALTFLAGFLLTVFFSPKPKIENAKAASLSDFKFPRADEGDPVPRWYGTNKFKGANTIWAGDFQAKAITKKVKTGLFSSKKQTVGYKYYVGLNLAVALGKNFAFRRVWAGKYELWNGCTTGDCENVVNVNQPNLFGGEEKNGGFVGSVALYCGNYDQNQDPYLVSKLGADVPAYNGIAHMVFRKCYFGNSPNIEPIYVEGSLFTNSLGLTDYRHIAQNGLDANPVEVLHDLIVNEYANMNVDPAAINTAQWRTVANRVWTENNGMSVVVANSNTGGEIAKQILRQINATMFQNPSTGLWDIVLIRQDYNIEDLPVLGPGQISSVSSFTKKLWNETNNRVRVKYIDREKDYKEDAVAQADDFANIRFQKAINPTEIGMPTVTVAALANAIAARELANLNVPLYQCEITADRTEIALLPGSPFVLTWPEYGIVSIVMRARKIGLGTLENGRMTIGVVQDEFASDAVVMAPPQSDAVPIEGPEPQPIDAIEIMELPYWLEKKIGLTHLNSDAIDPQQTGGYYMALIEAPSSSSGSFDLLAIYGYQPDYILANDNEPYPATGTLAATFERMAGYTSGFAPFIELDGVSDVSALGNFQPEVWNQGFGLVWLNGEFMQYQNFTILENGNIRLNNVRRALFDTGWQGGEIGDKLFFIEDQTGVLDEALPLSVTIKFHAVDQSAGGEYDWVAGVDPEVPYLSLSYAEEGKSRPNLPLPPDKLKPFFEETWITPEFDGGTEVGATIRFEWLERNRLDDTTATIIDEGAASSVAPVGTTYRLRYQKEGAAIPVTIEDGITTNQVEVTLTEEMAGNTLFHVWAIDADGAMSYAPTTAPLIVVSADTLKIDDDYVSIDSSPIQID